MGVRTWALRRLLGRLRITDDIVRYLSTFQRLGETVEVELPGELLPIGARTLFRAIRTRAAAQLGVDWVWPYWLVRQLDPESPSFIPRGHLPVLTNVTRRNWTMVGNLGSVREAVVDERGLVMPWFDGWSLDWWVGTSADGSAEADGRGMVWHFPSRASAVRQHLLDETPVVETVMRVPGGDVAHRAYAAPGDEELVVIEVENRTALPIAVALAVRPYNPEGLAVVERIALHERTVTVDGRPALLLPRAPARVAGSTFHDGDSSLLIVAGAPDAELPKQLRCEVGLAQAAFVYPLAHGATLRAAAPLWPERRTRRRRLARRRARRFPEPPSLPSGADSARGWAAHRARGLQIEMPESSLTRAVAANRLFLLLFHDGDHITPGPFTYHRFWFRDAAYMVVALDRFGMHKEAAEVLRGYPNRQHIDGFFFSQRQEWDANGCAIWSIAEHWRLTRDAALVADLAPAIGRAARWIIRKRASKRRQRDPAVQGLLPAGVSAEHLGPFDYYYWDDFWSLRGLIDAAMLLRLVGRHDDAAEADAEAVSLRGAIDASLALVAARLGSEAIPAGPRRRHDPGMIGSLVACHPLDLLGADHPAIAASAQVIRDRFCIGEAIFQGISHTGLGTYLTLQLAFVELAAGDRRALDRLEWMLRAATPTFTWPEAIHPRHGGGCMGDGQHGWAAAELLSFARALMVREVDCGLALLSMLPESMRGQPIEVHDAPTHHGLLSFALRWHDERPALLWELEPHDPTAPVRITAPGLDPTWSTTDLKGEALLTAAFGRA